MKDRPGDPSPLTLMRADMLAARDQLDQAQYSAHRGPLPKDPRNLQYIVALSRLAMRQGDKDGEALKILDQAEKELGASRNSHSLAWHTGVTREAIGPRLRWPGSRRTGSRFPWPTPDVLPRAARPGRVAAGPA